MTCHQLPWSLSRSSAAGDTICGTTRTATTTPIALMRILTSRSITVRTPSAGPGSGLCPRRVDDGRASADRHGLVEICLEPRLHRGPVLDDDAVVVGVPQSMAGHHH